MEISGPQTPQELEEKGLSLENSLEAFQTQIIFSSQPLPLPKGLLVNQMSFLTPDILVICCFKDVIIYDVNSKVILRTIENAHDSNVSCSIPILEMSKIITGGFDGKIKVWDIIDENLNVKLLTTMSNNGEWVMNCMRLADPSLIACIVNRKGVGVLVVWNFFYGTKVVTFNNIELGHNQFTWQVDQTILLAKRQIGDLYDINFQMFNYSLCYNYHVTEDTSCIYFYRPKAKNNLMQMKSRWGYTYIGSYMGKVTLCDNEGYEIIRSIALEPEGMLISEIYSFPCQKKHTELLLVRNKQRVNILTTDLRIIQIVNLYDKSPRVTSLLGIRENFENIFLSTVDGKIFRGKIINIVTKYLFIVKKALERQYSKHVIKMVFGFLCKIEK